jgi:hypothetical protein
MLSSHLILLTPEMTGLTIVPRDWGSNNKNGLEQDRENPCQRSYDSNTLQNDIPKLSPCRHFWNQRVSVTKLTFTDKDRQTYRLCNSLWRQDDIWWTWGNLLLLKTILDIVCGMVKVFWLM